MNYLSADTKIIERGMESISFYVADAEVICCQNPASALRILEDESHRDTHMVGGIELMGAEELRILEDESHRDTLRLFKGFMVAALFSLLFWMTLAFLLLR